MKTTMIGPWLPNPNHMATSSPQIRYGNASPTTTKSCSIASIRGDTPIANPTTPPTARARRNPISNRVRLIPKFLKTVPSWTISIISSNTPDGIGMIRDGERGTNNCHATRNRSGAVIRAARGVVKARLRREGVDPEGRAVPAVACTQRSRLM